jgi:hypothetical protein
MALTIYTSKDNQWREYVNPLRGMTLERIVQLIELGERELVQGLMVAVEQRRVMWPAGGRSGRSELGGISALSGGQRTEDGVDAGILTQRRRGAEKKIER